MLSELDKQRFARQLLLVDVGVPGQQKLCGAGLSVAADADADALDVAREYLLRAGVRGDVTEPKLSVQLRVPTSAAVEALAGDPALRVAACWLAGSFAAVEAIKEIVGVGQAASLHADLTLTEPAAGSRVRKLEVTEKH